MNSSTKCDVDERVPLHETLGGRQKIVLFMSGMGLFSLLLIPYLIAQAIALFFVDTEGYMNKEILIYSMGINISVCVLLFLSWLRFRLKYSDLKNEAKIRGIMFFSSMLLLFATLGHLHLIGSQNSMHHLLIMAVLLVVSWFLSWREVLIFFVVGNLGLALLVALEMSGILPYAPLLASGNELAKVFLDWRGVLAQGINYTLVLIVSTSLIWKLRRLIEKSDQTLYAEIEARKRSQQEKQELIEKLQDSLDQIKTLRELLPICAGCKNIRDDQGYWHQLEAYLHKHSDLKFSHGLCPDCAKKLYPDMDISNK